MEIDPIRMSRAHHCHELSLSLSLSLFYKTHTHRHKVLQMNSIAIFNFPPHTLCLCACAFLFVRMEIVTAPNNQPINQINKDRDRNQGKNENKTKVVAAHKNNKKSAHRLRCTICMLYNVNILTTTKNGAQEIQGKCLKHEKTLLINLNMDDLQYT